MTDTKQAIQRFHAELLSNGDRELANELLAPDVVHHGHQTLRDRDSFLNVLTNDLRYAFPDLTSEVEELFGEDGKVVARYTVRGTHREDFGDVPATGNRVEVGAMSIYRFSGDRIAEIWTETDAQVLMRQLEE